MYKLTSNDLILFYKIMALTLFYMGELKSSGNRNKRSKESLKEHKHNIRIYFHNQLKLLWEDKSMKSLREFVDKGEYPVKKINNVKFIPLVIKNFYVELDIIMLVPGHQWMSLFSKGDLDNRIKTLLDALRIPSNKEELPNNFSSSPNPFYCLLEDDSLISHISICKYRWWKEHKNQEVSLIINVKMKEHMSIIFNFAYPSFLKH